MKPAILLNHIELYPVLHKFRFKKDIPKHIQGRPVAVSFGLWGAWYVVLGLNGIVCKDGTEMPFHEAYLNGVGRVIGPRDLQAASGKPYAEAWRASYDYAIRQRCGLPLPA